MASEVGIKGEVAAGEVRACWVRVAGGGFRRLGEGSRRAVSMYWSAASSGVACRSVHDD